MFVSEDLFKPACYNCNIIPQSAKGYLRPLRIKKRVGKKQIFLAILLYSLRKKYCLYLFPKYLYVSPKLLWPKHLYITANSVNSNELVIINSKGLRKELGLVGPAIPEFPYVRQASRVLFPLLSGDWGWEVRGLTTWGFYKHPRPYTERALAFPGDGSITLPSMEKVVLKSDK